MLQTLDNLRTGPCAVSDYEGLTVSFTEEAWFNATAAAERFGRRPIDWLNQAGTQEYIAALAQQIKCEPGSLLKTRRGHAGLDTAHLDRAADLLEAA